ncbi:hypothetical protein OA003_00235 [bacterium]|nr:hypothetical protein [bacterium]
MAIVIGGRTVQADDGRGYQPQGVNRPTQQQQNQYQQMAQSMADAGIRSLSGRTTDTERGSRARDIQRDFLYDKSSPGGETTPAEDMIDDFDYLSSRRGDLGPGELKVTEGDPLKRSIVSNILRGKPPRETGIFGLDTSGLKLPSIGPVLGSLEGLKSTDTFFKNLATKGAGGLSSKDKVTLVNLVNRLGTSPESFEDLLQTYADKNEVPADDLFANFNRAYSDIQSDVAQSGVSEYFNRIGEIGEYDDSLKTMAGDLTGTRDTEGVITLENVTDNLGTEGLQFLKVTNPQAYYRLRPNDPDLANESFVSTGDKVADRRFNAKIMEARAEAMNRQSRQDANMGQGIMAASPALPGLIRNLPPDTPVIGGPADPPNPVLTPVPVGGVAPTTTSGITPFNINQFYASLPQYTQQGIMNPNLAQFYQNLQAFPRVV